MATNFPSVNGFMESKVSSGKRRLQSFNTSLSAFDNLGLGPSVGAISARYTLFVSPHLLLVASSFLSYPGISMQDSEILRRSSLDILSDDV